MMKDYQPEPHDDMSDDADLLRSLRPRQPELNWQAIVDELPSDATVNVTPVRTKIVRNLATSWWSGALAGSLITLAIVSWSKSNDTDHSLSGVDNRQIDNRQIDSHQIDNHQVASHELRSQAKQPNGPTNTQTITAEQKKNDPSIANNGNSKVDSNASESVRENPMSDPTEVYMLRHGLDSRLVSRSMATYSLPDSRLQYSETSTEPPTQSALRKMLLDYQ
ncbi:MAG: hypothetical protein U0930_18100 [Pirellulales bacterium]